MQKDRFAALAERVRNWGRWGEDDQRGTINHIGPEALLRASGCVSAGKLFSLGMRFDRNGPQRGIRRFNPHLYVTALTTPIDPAEPDFVFSDDVIHMPLQAATQWDALSHVHYHGILYNNRPAADVLGMHGTCHAGVEHLASPGIMSRGVLLDIARLRNVSALPVDDAISIADLEAACAHAGVTVEPGDIVLIRTGHIQRFTIDGDRDAFNGLQPGLDPECAGWLQDKRAAAVAADNISVEVRRDGDQWLPFHMLAIRDMGMPLGEMFDLEALAADCAADGRYTCLLSAPPLAVTGAFGSPINPLALK